MKSAFRCVALLWLQSAACLLAEKATPVPIPNADVSDVSLKGFRFRYDEAPNRQDQYVDNHKWVNGGKVSGRNCVMIQAPKAVLEGPTAKVESAFVQIQPGATYRYEVDYYLDKTGSKMWAETFAVDPRPDNVREEEEAKGKRVTIFRFRPFAGYPALLMVHRAQCPPLGGEDETERWVTATKEFTLPMEWPANLPFTIHGDGSSVSFPIREERRGDNPSYEVTEVRIRMKDQALPVRLTKGLDYQVQDAKVVFTKAPPEGSEATVNVRWKLKPRYLSIKAIALGGQDGSVAAFTNFRLTKIKEPGEVAAPVDTIR